MSSATSVPSTKTVINDFRGEFSFLSNLYESTIYVDGERYASVEHAYQAHKTLDPWSRKLVREARTSRDAKRLGKSVTLRGDWEAIKVDLMRSFVRKKFENPFLRPLLLATGDADLVEGNTWGDTFWGVCRGEGQNWLGRLLMEVRDEIKNDDSSAGFDTGEVA
jgi:ribA/ribD-fused uncharacterized protein